MKEVAEELRNEHAEPGADNAADQDTERYDRENKLDIVGDDCAIGVSDSLQQSNLLALKRNKACQRQIDQERRYQQEDRPPYLSRRASSRTMVSRSDAPLRSLTVTDEKAPSRL